MSQVDVFMTNPLMAMLTCSPGGDVQLASQFDLWIHGQLVGANSDYNTI